MGRDTKDNERPEDPVKLTIDTYDEVAEKYCKMTMERGDRGFQEEMIEETLSMIPGEAVVLDLGCGDGRDTGYMHAKGVRVVGLDLSKSMIALAKKKYPRCDLVYGDMRKTCFPDDKFDCVWASASIIHIPKDELDVMASEIRRTLKDHGIFVFSFKEGEGEGYVDTSMGKRYFSYYRLEEIENMMIHFKMLSYKVYPGMIMGSRFIYCWFETDSQNSPR